MSAQKFVPSKYQQAIYDFITNGSGNAVVSAVAGSGKTTTILNAMNLIPAGKRVLFMAFNYEISEELKKKVPQSSNVFVKTVHSYGMSALNKEFSGMKVLKPKYSVLLRKIYEYHQTDDKKLLKDYDFKRESQFNLIEEMRFNEVEMKEIENKVGYLSRVTRLCDLGRLNLIDINNKGIGVEQLANIAKKHNIEIVNGECNRAWNLIKLGTQVISQIDFTDMIYLPIYFKMSMMKFDYVFIDECQDLNECQREVMLKAINPDGGRFIAVGDEAQAIYGFAGADEESFKKLCELPNTIKLPLSVCYRCASTIIDLAKTIVPEIEPREGAKEGVVEHEYSYNDVRSGDMILCRQTFPLVSLCLRYLASGIKAHVVGSEIGNTLIGMIEDTKRKTEKWSMENVFARIYRERDKIVASIMRKEKVTEQEALEDSTVKLFEDKIMVIELLSKGITEPQLLINKINDIFTKEKGDGIILSTIHRSKGLEADRVFIIHEELMPSKYARKEWEMKQESNLIYVAYTRAKSMLGFITDFNAFDGYQSSENEASKKEIKESQFVGAVGEKVKVELEVVSVREIQDTAWGTSTLFEMKDKKGNLYSKFGIIADRFITSNHEQVQEGAQVRFNATVKAHKEYKGVKTTVLSTLAKY